MADARDILIALRAKNYHAANEGFAQVMQAKLADRLATEKQAVANESLHEAVLEKGTVIHIGGIPAALRHSTDVECATLDESHMPSAEVQRVFDETGGDIGETELLCGIQNLRVNDVGQVVSYVTEAIDRPDNSGQGYDDDYMHNPYHDVIRKYGYEYSHSTPTKDGVRHTYKQGNHFVGVFGNSWSTSSSDGVARPAYGGHPNTARSGADLERHLLDKARRYGLEESFMYGGLDSKCDKCENMADWRGRDPKTGKILGAACKAHKDLVRSELIQRLQGTKR